MIKLIFVYNADSGRLNALQDSLHKLISPSTYDCRLCQLTHGFFSEKEEWREFVKDLDAQCVFLHRDEFDSVPDVSLPAVFIQEGESFLEVISSTQFSKIENLEELTQLIKDRVKRTG